MRNLKKILTLVLALVMAFALMAVASAADNGTQTYGYGSSWYPSDWSYSGSLDIEAAPDQCLYWMNELLDPNPVIVYDQGNGGNAYLKFGLSKVGKMVKLYEKYGMAFRLDKNLADLELWNNGRSCLYAKLPWRQNFKMSDYLTQTTLRDIAQNYSEANAETILAYLKTRPEYAGTEFFKYDVDYYESCMNTAKKNVIAGLNQIWSNVASENLTVTQTIALANKYTNNTAIRSYLGAVHSAAISLPASNPMLLATLSQQNIDTLYTGVQHIASVYWKDDWTQLENYAVAVPFPQGTVYQWPAVAR